MAIDSTLSATGTAGQSAAVLNQTGIGQVYGPGTSAYSAMGGTVAPTVTPTTVYGGGYTATNNPFVTPTSSTPSPSTPTAPATTEPVVTSDAADQNLTQLANTYLSLQNSVANQKSTLAQQAAQTAANTAKTNYDNAQLAIQQQDSNTAATTAASKAAAAAALAGGTTNTSTVTPTPSGGTQTTTATSPTDTSGLGATASNTNSNLSANTSTYNTKLQSVQDQSDTLAGQLTAQLNEVLSGTFPLSAPQQALITSLQNQLTSNVALQTTANAANTGAATEAAMRSGGEYTPTQTAGTIANTISAGIARIQNLDNSAASTMAKLEDGFQQQDYTEIMGQYDALQSQLTEKGNTLKDMYDSVQTTLQDEQTNAAAAVTANFNENMAVANFNLTSSQDTFDNNLKTATFNLTQAQDTIDNGFKAGQLSVAQYAASQKAIDDATSNSIAAYNAGLIPGGTFNPATGTFTASDGTNTTSPADLPGYTQLPNGSPVIQHPNGDSFYVNQDGSLTKFQPGDAAKFATDASAASTLSKAQTLYNTISGGQNNSTNDSTYSSLVQSLPANIQKMLPSVGMFTGGVFGGNTAGGNASFSSAFNAVNNDMTSIMPSATPSYFGQIFPNKSAAGQYLTETGQQSVYTNLKAQGFTDPQILQIINGQ